MFVQGCDAKRLTKETATQSKKANKAKLLEAGKADESLDLIGEDCTTKVTRDMHAEAALKVMSLFHCTTAARQYAIKISEPPKICKNGAFTCGSLSRQLTAGSLFSFIPSTSSHMQAVFASKKIIGSRQNMHSLQTAERVESDVAAEQKDTSVIAIARAEALALSLSTNIDECLFLPS